MKNKALLKNLHAIRFRIKGYSSKSLLRFDEEDAFLSFLKRALGDNVFIVNTRLGLDIYYLATENRLLFIQKSFWLFQSKNDASSHSYHSSVSSGSAVLNFFDSAVHSLSRHPQLFLVCCKKLTAKFHAVGTPSLLNRILFSSFNLLLHRLINENRAPFASKIMRLVEEKAQLFVKNSDAKKRLLKDFSLQNAIN